MSENTHVVDEVGTTKVGAKTWWLVGVRAPNGDRMAHVFPPQVLHWRAAEYEIDPTDAQTLLDIVLHERFMTEEEHHHEAPDFVFNTDVDTARRAHLARIEVVKTRARVTDPDGLLSKIHRHHQTTLDPEAHRKRTADARELRAHNRKVRATNG